MTMNIKKVIARLIGAYLNLLVFILPQRAGREGFYLFCTPQGPPLKDHQRKFLESAERSCFVCNGDTIQVYRWGKGSKNLLFLHGWQSHSFRWRNYIESFSPEDYTIYALDAPGHGLSGGRYLNLVIYTHVIEAFFRQYPPVHAVISHSLGSFAALYTFFRIPSLSVQKLIVTGIPGEAKEFVAFYQKMLGLSSRTINAVRRSFKTEIRHLPEYFSAAKFATAVKIPGLIIHDEEDIETPYHHAIQIHRVWKESKLITTSGLGHNLRSAAVVKHIVDFVNHSGVPSINTHSQPTADMSQS